MAFINRPIVGLAGQTCRSPSISANTILGCPCRHGTKSIGVAIPDIPTTWPVSNFHVNLTRLAVAQYPRITGGQIFNYNPFIFVHIFRNQLKLPIQSDNVQRPRQGITFALGGSDSPVEIIKTSRGGEGIDRAIRWSKVLITNGVEPAGLTL